MSKDAIDNNLRQVVRNLQRRISALERQQQDVGQLSELSSDMGLVTAGEFRAGNGVEPGEGFSGVRMTADGIDGVANDVDQFTLSSATGKATAGAGAVTLDSDGLSITGHVSGVPNAIKFKDAGGNNITEIRGYEATGMRYTTIFAKSEADRITEIDITAEGNDATATEYGQILLIAGDGTNVRYITLKSTSTEVLFTDFGIDITGQKLITGDTGAITGGSETINDDAAFSFTPATARGVLILRSGGANTTIYGMFTFAAVAGTAYCYAWTGAGSSMVATTGALAGTTGTDGKVTVSAHTDGKIYIENRSGGNQICSWQIVAGT